MAKDDATARLARVTKLLTAQRDLVEKLQAVTDELDDALGGGIGIGQRLKLLRDHWSGLWQTRYRTPYQFNFVVDNAQLKRLLKTVTDEELGARMTRYARSDEPFYVKARHPFGLFVRSINEWAGAPKEAGPFDLGEVAGCGHVPQCASAPEHTRRTLQDRRPQA